MRCECLGVGRLGSSVAKVTDKKLLAQASDRIKSRKAR